jgi:hypothetical protein
MIQVKPHARLRLILELILEQPRVLPYQCPAAKLRPLHELFYKKNCRCTLAFIHFHFASDTRHTLNPPAQSTLPVTIRDHPAPAQFGLIGLIA